MNIFSPSLDSDQIRFSKVPIAMIRVIFAMLFLWSSFCAAAPSAIAEAPFAIQSTSSTPIQKRVPPPQQTTSAAGDQQPSPESEVKKLQGGWQVVKWEDESGQPATAEEMKEFTLYFDGDTLTMRKGKDDPGTKCQYRLDPAKAPKWIDLGMPALSEGSTVLQGIYSLQGDALTLCITSGLQGGVPPPRPTAFKTTPAEKYALLVLTRIR